MKCGDSLFHQKESQTKMKKPMSLGGEMVPLILEDVIIVDTAIEAATDRYTSECITAAMIIG